MSSFVHLLQRELHSLALARLVAVAAVVVGAWGATRTVGAAATWLIRHGERGVRRLERREQEETTISIVRTSVRYLAWALALVLSFIVVFGRPGTNTLVGASFLAIIVGFAVQRFLIDLVAGAVMFFEGWLQIGDQVKVEPWDVQGMVEEVSLRALVVRGAGGELQRVHNSQVLALKVFPRGYREAEISLVVRDAERACRIYQELVRWLPVDGDEVRAVARDRGGRRASGGPRHAPAARDGGTGARMDGAEPVAVAASRARRRGPHRARADRQLRR